MPHKFRLLTMKSSRILALTLLTALLTFGMILAVQAQEPAPTPSDNQVNAIAKQLYCPVCENVPLDVCPTQACAQWRALISQKLTEGWSETQIKDYFVEQYGDRVLGTPPPRGLNWLVYIIPPLVILGGAILLYRVLASMKKPSPSLAPAQNQTSSQKDEYIERLEEELRSK